MIALVFLLLMSIPPAPEPTPIPPVPIFEFPDPTYHSYLPFIGKAKIREWDCHWCKLPPVERP